MDNKQIEEAKLVLSKVKENMSVSPMILEHLNTLLSLAQLFLSVKGVPKKKKLPPSGLGSPYNPAALRVIGYNLCHDEYTTWLAGREQQGNHCKDCCCAKSWEALGIKEYDGLSIPEHIKALKEELFELKGGFK